MLVSTRGKWRKVCVVVMSSSLGDNLVNQQKLSGNTSRALFTLTMSISIPITPVPFFNLAAPATYQGIEVDWILDPTAQPKFDGSSDLETILAKLEANSPRDGPALPELPVKFHRDSPFPDVAKILDALDDYLAYR